MEFSIVTTDLKSSEIKPEKSLQKYFELVDKDIDSFFKGTLVNSDSCPACRKSEVSESFKKFHLEYSRCLNCHSVYMKKLPSQESINHFYRDGEARKFWIEDIWQSSEEIRLEKEIYPLIDWVNNFVVPSFKDQTINIAEIYSNNPGFYNACQTQKLNIFEIAPNFPKMESVISREHVSDLNNTKKYHAICLFNTLDRVEDPNEMMAFINDHMEVGGYCFITGILSTGLDSLVMKNEARTLLPPDRLTSFSFEGLNNFMDRNGFQVEELSTPGILDVENVKNFLKTNGDKGEGFFDYIFNVRKDRALIENLQMFLQQHRLSSRLRMVVKKREA